MHNPRKLLMLAGLVIFVVGLYGAWKAMHPQLTPEQQIKANVEDLRRQIENRNVKGVTFYFSKNFNWQGTSRREVIDTLKVGFLQARDVQLHVSNEQVTVNDDTAYSSGHFTISYKPSPDAGAQTQVGDFELEWTKEENRQWKITRAEGGKNIGQE